MSRNKRISDKKCKVCDKDEMEVKFYLRYKNICKDCHNNKQKEYNKKYSRSKRGYGWY